MLIKICVYALSEEQGGMHDERLTFRSPEMLAPARMPVAEGKKMENMPKKLPSCPRQLGTKLTAKISAVQSETVKLKNDIFISFLTKMGDLYLCKNHHTHTQQLTLHARHLRSLI